MRTHDYYTFLSELNLDARYLLDPVLGFLLGIDQSLLLVALVYVCLITTFLHRRGDDVTHSLASATIVPIFGYAVSYGSVMLLDLVYFACLLLGLDLLKDSSVSSLKRIGLQVLGGVLTLGGMYYSGPLAFIFVLITFLIFQYFSLSIPFLMSVFLAALSFGVTVFSTYSMEIFDYPREAFLVPVSKFNHVSDPLFGADRHPFPILVSKFMSLSEEGLIVVNILLCLFVILVILSQKSAVRIITKTNLFRLSTVLFLLLVLDRLLSGEVYRSALTIVPGLLFRPYPFLIQMLIVVIISFLFSRTLKLRDVSFVYVILGIFVFFNPYRVADIFPAALAKDAIDKKFTPSKFVSEQYTGETRAFGAVRVPFSTQPLSSCSATATKNTEKASAMLDGKLNTRWGTAGPQTPGDSVEIVCNTGLRFSAIRLRVPPGKTDFPRGFTLSAYKNDEQVVSFDAPEWFGPVFSTESGLDYFRGQGTVAIRFKKSYEVDRLKIQLTRGHPVFDWSVSEVEIADEYSK